MLIWRQRMSRLALQPEQVIPHGGEGLRIRLDIRRLRADVNVNAGEFN